MKQSLNIVNVRDCKLATIYIYIAIAMEVIEIYFFANSMNTNILCINITYGEDILTHFVELI